jgi:hypothetical protein
MSSRVISWAAADMDRPTRPIAMRCLKFILKI